MDIAQAGSVSTRRIKIIIEYDGSRFHGWQIQKNALSVQEELEKAVIRITGDAARVTGSGRTDTGVHAYGQTAHFDTFSKIPAEKFTPALNAVLPNDIAVRSSEEVDSSFHARFSATGKTYEYKILNRFTRSPILTNKAWHVREQLDMECLQKASAVFIGTHDFSAFCSSGHSVSTFERTIFSSEWMVDGECLVYRVLGNGFLYNMVRIMTGTMIEAGFGKRSIESIVRLFEIKDRNDAGMTAPPQGLYLVKVHY